jgi:predicted lipid-binding transport protein (Tim44 family)
VFYDFFIFFCVGFIFLIDNFIMDPIVGSVIASAVNAVSSIFTGSSNAKIAQAQAQAESYKTSTAMVNSYLQTKVGQQNIVLYSVIGVVSLSVLLMVFKMRK